MIFCALSYKITSGKAKVTHLHPEINTLPFFCTKYKHILWNSRTYFPHHSYIFLWNILQIKNQLWCKSRGIEKLYSWSIKQDHMTVYRFCLCTRKSFYRLDTIRIYWIWTQKDTIYNGKKLNHFSFFLTFKLIYCRRRRQALTIWILFPSILSVDFLFKELLLCTNHPVGIMILGLPENKESHVG